MARKSRFDGVIVNRVVDEHGHVHAYDANERSCWGSRERERVVLMHDLRKYAADLHMGQLGWTVPGTTDGYKWIDVVFDTGVRLPVLVYALQRVDPERAAVIAGAVIAKNLNTRFDADPLVAARCYREWIKRHYEPWVAVDELVEHGSGNEELYAFTFPSLRELAELKRASHYPLKVGYSAGADAGAIGRIRGQIVEAAAFPERPTLLLVYRTHNGRALETAVHGELRKLGRKMPAAPGAEWFLSNEREVIDLCERLSAGVTTSKLKPVAGASPNLVDLADAGAQVVCWQDPSSACVHIRVTEAKDPQDSR